MAPSWHTRNAADDRLFWEFVFDTIQAPSLIVYAAYDQSSEDVANRTESCHLTLIRFVCILGEGTHMNLKTQIRALEESTNALAKAASVRDKVSLADRIYRILAECETLVERFVVTEIGSNGNRPGAGEEDSTHSEPGSQNQFKKPTGKEFKDLTLAQIGKKLLEERGMLHGSEIEKRAKAGGFKSDSEHFQSYLAVAFKRAGGVENVGKNRWNLNPNIQPGGKRATMEGPNRLIP